MCSVLMKTSFSAQNLFSEGNRKGHLRIHIFVLKPVIFNLHQLGWEVVLWSVMWSVMWSSWVYPVCLHRGVQCVWRPMRASCCCLVSTLDLQGRFCVIRPSWESCWLGGCWSFTPCCLWRVWILERFRAGLIHPGGKHRGCIQVSLTVPLMFIMFYCDVDDRMITVILQ